MYREGGKTLRECVSCDFQEELLVTATPQPLATRVSAPPEPAAEPQAVRFIDPKNT